MKARLRWLVSILLLLGSCRSFDFERQRVFLRYQPEADVLDVVIAYEGVGATKSESKEVAGTIATLEAIGQGKRHFMIWDWPFDFDIENAIEGARYEPPDSESVSRSFLEYETNISVIESRFLVHGSAGAELCLVQRLRFGQGSRALRLIDEFINELLLDEQSDEGGDPLLDPASDALLLARAKRGGSWARFDGTELEVTIPMTAEQAARQLENLLTEPHQITACLADSLSSLQVTGEDLRLRFAPAADGWIAFTLADDARECRDDVAEHFLHAGTAVAGDLEAEVARLKASP